jgi:hypothetical protein
MNDGDLLTQMGTDGQAWAKQWISYAALLLARSNNDSLVLLDEGWMIGWMANAIEAGRSAANHDWAERLAAIDPLHDTGMGDIVCALCGSTRSTTHRSQERGTYWIHTHELDCLWIQACLHLGPIPDDHQVVPEPR